MKKFLLFVVSSIALIFLVSYISARPIGGGPTGGIPWGSPGVIGDINPKAGTFNPSVTVTDGTDTHIIKTIQESGGGDQLRIGVDEDYRLLTLCDYGDVDADFGLSAAPNPTLAIVDATGVNYIQIYSDSTYSYLAAKKDLYIYAPTTNGIEFSSGKGYIFSVSYDITSGAAITLDSGSGDELTDTNAEQAWLSIEPKIKQTDTAAWVGLLMDVTIDTEGSGTQELMALRVGTTDKFVVDDTGAVDMGSIFTINTTDVSHGGHIRQVYYATSGTLTGATDKIELNIPTAWVIESCQLHVKTAVVDSAGDDTWSSELNDGAQEEVISAGSAAAQNTNVNHFAHANAGYGGTLTDAETDILLTPNGGNFSSGEIEAHCLCRGFDAWDAE